MKEKEKEGELKPLPPTDDKGSNENDHEDNTASHWDQKDGGIGAFPNDGRRN